MRTASALPHGAISCATKLAEQRGYSRNEGNRTSLDIVVEWFAAAALAPVPRQSPLYGGPFSAFALAHRETALVVPQLG